MRAGLWLMAAVVMMSSMARGQAFNGFDRNDYPGDALLGALHKSFSYTGYWLNPPPGEKASSWTGKRSTLRESGFGFLLLWNGRPDKELKGKEAASLGRSDAAAAVAVAARERFPKGALIFLDQEEGGRLLPEQLTYVLSWVDAVRRTGWKGGVYCSGIPVDDGNGGTITTAQDIERQAGSWKIPLWVARDECPPSPGCVIESKPRLPAASLGLPDAVVWQYALSPRRPEFTGGCPKNYAPDGYCYAPGVYHGPQGFVDLNTASSADPSGGR
ncbi:MAG TPA: glycoside hydrolase domain-containing protein [Acidobacteriaceae bacterium]